MGLEKYSKFQKIFMTPILIFCELLKEDYFFFSQISGCVELPQSLVC